MRIRFWGTRGSLAKPGRSTVRYGGNTACVEVRTTDNALIVLDCGTGAHNLGQALVASGSHPVHGHLLISHTHWDHIQGFPFFAPLFSAGNIWDIYAPGDLGRRLEETLAGQMEYAYFPVTLDQLGATIRYHDLAEGHFHIGSVQVTTRYLNHPALTLGYRLEAGGGVVVYATDHEPHAVPLQNASRPPEEGMQITPVHQEDLRHVEFLRGADLVIHDAQYTLAEYPDKQGWGHSPIEYAVDVAMAAGAKRLALFHHDPLRGDAALSRLLKACRRRVANNGAALEVFVAAEGAMVEVGEQADVETQAVRRVRPTGVRKRQKADGKGETVLIVDDETDLVQLLMATLEPEGYRLLPAYDGAAALRLARTERPSLILLDWGMPGIDGLEVCRTLRADRDPQLRRIPVVMITGQEGQDKIATGFAAGVTDYLTKPFSPSHLRSRLRGWLLRSRPESGAPTIVDGRAFSPSASGSGRGEGGQD